MAGIKHTWSTSVKNDAGANVISDVDVLTAPAEENFSLTVAGGGTTEIVTVKIDVSQITSFFVESSVAVSMVTKDGVTTKQTIPLAAKKALGWNVNDTVNACPLTDDLTSFEFTNAGTTAATVVGGFLLDV